MFRRMRSRSATIVGAGRARPARAVDRPVAACPARRRGPRLPLLGQVPHPYAELVRERLEVFDAVPKQGYFGKICSDAFVGARLGARRIHPMQFGRLNMPLASEGPSLADAQAYAEKLDVA